MAAWVSNSGLLGGADLTIPLSRVTTASGAPQGDCNGCFYFLIYLHFIDFSSALDGGLRARMWPMRT